MQVGNKYINANVFIKNDIFNIGKIYKNIY